MPKTRHVAGTAAAEIAPVLPIDFFDELSLGDTDERSAEALLHGAVANGDTIAAQLFC